MLSPFLQKIVLPSAGYAKDTTCVSRLIWKEIYSSSPTSRLHNQIYFHTAPQFSCERQIQVGFLSLPQFRVRYTFPFLLLIYTSPESLMHIVPILHPDKVGAIRDYYS